MIQYSTKNMHVQKRKESRHSKPAVRNFSAASRSCSQARSMDAVINCAMFLSLPKQEKRDFFAFVELGSSSGYRTRRLPSDVCLPSS